MLSKLLARYDVSLLRPPLTPDPAPSAGAAAVAHEQAALRRLLAWCHEGTGDGAAPLLRPGARPRMPLPLSVALLGGLPLDSPAALLEDLALQLDGTHQLLAAGPRWRQRLFRLRVKGRECCWWLRRAPGAPWDSGYLIDSPAAPARLAQWQPRRPTLVIAHGLADEPLRSALRALAARQAHFAQPVRLLIAAAAPPPALAHWPAAAAADNFGPLSFRPLRPAVD